MTQILFSPRLYRKFVEKTDWRTAVRAHAEDSVCIDIYVEPGASSQRVGPYDPWRQRVKVSVGSPAHDGKANREVLRAFSDLLDVPVANVRIQRGATTRRKTLRADGIGLEAVIETLSGILDGEGDVPT